MLLIIRNEEIMNLKKPTKSYPKEAALHLNSALGYCVWPFLLGLEQTWWLVSPSRSDPAWIVIGSIGNSRAWLVCAPGFEHQWILRPPTWSHRWDRNREQSWHKDETKTSSSLATRFSQHSLDSSSQTILPANVRIISWIHRLPSIITRNI